VTLVTRSVIPTGKQMLGSLGPRGGVVRLCAAHLSPTIECSHGLARRSIADVSAHSMALRNADRDRRRPTSQFVFVSAVLVQGELRRHTLGTSVGTWLSERAWCLGEVTSAGQERAPLARQASAVHRLALRQLQQAVGDQTRIRSPLSMA
jgi:hypothetical protein